jgi:hypothetical protein
VGVIVIVLDEPSVIENEIELGYVPVPPSDSDKYAVNEGL